MHVFYMRNVRSHDWISICWGVILFHLKAVFVSFHWIPSPDPVVPSPLCMVFMKSSTVCFTQTRTTSNVDRTCVPIRQRIRGLSFWKEKGGLSVPFGIFWGGIKLEREVARSSSRRSVAVCEVSLIPRLEICVMLLPR